MTEYEALDALFSANEAMHNSFQYWLSITFALIVTVHLGRRHLTGGIVVAISVLYLLGSALFFVDYLHWLSLLGFTANFEFWEGYDYGPLKTYLRVALFLIGTVVAEGFLVLSYVQGRKTKDAN